MARSTLGIVTGKLTTRTPWSRCQGYEEQLKNYSKRNNR